MEDHGVPKYEAVSPPIDCASRIELCHGACCRFWFALAPEDVEEGVIQWNARLPHLIAKKADGSCVHQDPSTRGCTAYVNRPAICRTYDCRKDARIWLDFEQRIPNPALTQPDWIANEPMLARAPSVSIHEVVSQLRRAGQLPAADTHRSVTSNDE